MGDNEYVKKFVRYCRNVVIDYVREVYKTQIERSDIMLFILKTNEEAKTIEVLAVAEIFDGVFFRLTFDIRGKQFFVNVYENGDGFRGSLTEEDVDALNNFIPKE